MHAKVKMAVKMADKFLERVAVAREFHEFKISRVNTRRATTIPGKPRERKHFPEIKTVR